MQSKGIDVKCSLAEHTGKATGLCTDMSTYRSCDPEHGDYGLAGTIGSSFPIAGGWGQAAKKNGRGQLVVRTIMTLSITFDHRVMDGVPVTRFYKKMKDLIENSAYLRLKAGAWPVGYRRRES